MPKTNKYYMLIYDMYYIYVLMYENKNSITRDIRVHIHPYYVSIIRKYSWVIVEKKALIFKHYEFLKWYLVSHIFVVKYFLGIYIV